MARRGVPCTPSVSLKLVSACVSGAYNSPLLDCPHRPSAQSHVVLSLRKERVDDISEVPSTMLILMGVTNL